MYSVSSFSTFSSSRRRRVTCVTSRSVTVCCSWPARLRLTFHDPFLLLSPLALFTMYHDMEGELIRAYQLLMELSEQNNHNHKMSNNLHSLTDTLKVHLSSTCAWLLKTYINEVFYCRRRRLTSHRGSRYEE